MPQALDMEQLKVLQGVLAPPEERPAPPNHLFARIQRHMVHALTMDVHEVRGAHGGASGGLKGMHLPWTCVRWVGSPIVP